MVNAQLITDKNIKFREIVEKNINKPIHFIGLGGIGMSGLAKFLLELGYKVSGSDLKDGPTMTSISGQGGTVFVGHHAENIGNACAIVVSTAINEENPEIIEAKKNNIPIFHRSQVLEALMSGLGLKERQQSIGISGTHGKTTTSGMSSIVFDDAKYHPSMVVGGVMPFLNTNSKLGNGKYFIAELDESDGSIELYTPDISVITNLEFDHPDHYTEGFEQLISTFERYVSELSPDAKIVINTDCEGNRELLGKINHKGIILYSIDSSCELHSKADYRAEDIKTEGFKTTAIIYKGTELLGELNLSVPGAHNISNALAVIAVATECGIKFDNIAKSLKRFTGMKRRFQILGTANGAKIVDDYAHHPTEVQATLKAAKSVTESAESGRVVAIFQPHRYSRLANLWNDFTKSFSDADLVYICDVYSAGESTKSGVSSEKLCQEIEHSNVSYVAGPIEKVAETIYPDLKENDLVLTIGAGDITKLGQFLLEKLGLNAENQ